MFYFKTANPVEAREWILGVGGKRFVLVKNLLFITAKENFGGRHSMKAIEGIVRFAGEEEREGGRRDEMVYWHWPLAGNILGKSLPVTVSNFKKSMCKGQKDFQCKEFPDPRRCILFIELAPVGLCGLKSVFPAKIAGNGARQTVATQEGSNGLDCSDEFYDDGLMRPVP